VYCFGTRLRGQWSIAPIKRTSLWTELSNIVKAVVASALDENGEARFSRKWNEEFIDAPLVKDQR